MLILEAGMVGGGLGAWRIFVRGSGVELRLSQALGTLDRGFGVLMGGEGASLIFVGGASLDLCLS